MSWDEYKVKFLVSKGHNEQEVVEKIKNGEELKVDEESERLGPVARRQGACSPGGPWGQQVACCGLELAGGGWSVGWDRVLAGDAVRQVGIWREGHGGGAGPAGDRAERLSPLSL